MNRTTLPPNEPGTHRLLLLPTGDTPYTLADCIALVESAEPKDLVNIPVTKESALRLLRLSERTGYHFEVLGRCAVVSGLPILEEHPEELHTVSDRYWKES